MTGRTGSTIGVLGGMGPEATILLMRRIMAATPANDDADHVPLLVDNNTQVPSRIEALIEGRGDDPGPVLASMARRLEVAGAGALVMPCNTAHAYTDAVRDAVTIPFLSMVELTADALAGAYPNGRIGILASPAIKITGLYQRALEPHGMSARYLDDQDALLAAIRALKRDASDTQAGTSLLQSAEVLMDQGADCVLIGCSEFSLLTPKLAATVPAVDSIDVLAGAAVAFAKADEASPFSSHITDKAGQRPGAATVQISSGR